MQIIFAKSQFYHIFKLIANISNMSIDNSSRKKLPAITCMIRLNVEQDKIET